MNEKVPVSEALFSDMDAIKSYVSTLVLYPAHEGAYDMDDVYQEAYIAYMRAYETYDAERGASAVTWARRPIKRAVIDFLRSQNRRADHESCEGAIPDDAYGTLIENTPYIAPYTEVEESLILSGFDRVFDAARDAATSYTKRIGIAAIKNEVHGQELSALADMFGVTASYLSVCKSRAAEDLRPAFAGMIEQHTLR